MNLMETIANELRTMERGIERADDGIVVSSLRKLDEILAADRERLPTQLLHFLERRSYQKALAYIDDELRVSGKGEHLKG